MLRQYSYSGPDAWVTEEGGEGIRRPSIIALFYPIAWRLVADDGNNNLIVEVALDDDQHAEALALGWVEVT